MERASPTYSLTLALLLLLCGGAFIGCGTDPDHTVPGRTLPADTLIALIGPSVADANSAGICGGAQRYAATYPNVRCLTVTPPDAELGSLAAAVDEALASKPLAICLYVKNAPVDGEVDGGQKASGERKAASDENAEGKQSPSLDEVIERIRRRSIVLVTIGPRLKDAAIYGQVEVALPEAAETLAKNLKSLLPPAFNSFGYERRERSYALFHANGRDRCASDTYTRFVANLGNRTELALLEETNTWLSERTPQQLISDTIGRFPSVELIVTLDPEPWLLLRPRFRLPAGNHFATLGAAPRLWPRLQSGEAVALVGPLDGEIGYAAMELAAQGLMTIPDAPTRRVIHCELVTKANLDDFARRYAAAANLELRDLLPFVP
jgi:hypothetical protein